MSGNRTLTPLTVLPVWHTGVLPVERPADIETGEFNKQASLVYSYGATTPSDNFKLYTTVVTSMAAMFRERCTARPASETSLVGVAPCN